ncbi:MAG: hypothetical protein EOO60_07660, partial [Hymenobacter sp.]
MTAVIVGSTTGYFSDPYPVRTFTPSTTSSFPSFVGTTKQLLTCPGTIQPACFASSPNTIAPGPFTQQAALVGTTINGFENLNAYQDNAGAWQMAVTALVSKTSGGKEWSVILHAHPTTASVGIPTAWVADALLVGDFGQFASANYDGKYFEDSGTLYLLYSMKLTGQTLQDGIVAQVMVSAAKPDLLSSPVPMLGPENSNGGYNSELFDGLPKSSDIRLIETGNIIKIQGKYVMTYSDGGYNRPDYKAGIAWSDTFLPPSGSYYQRVQKIDTDGLWGQPNHAEVQYLLQSQIPQWPNYVADQVLSPGVPSIVSDTNGHYYLMFAGYDPSDAPTNADGYYQGSHRRPYYVRLNVQIPAAASV